MQEYELQKREEMFEVIRTQRPDVTLSDVMTSYMKKAEEIRIQQLKELNVQSLKYLIGVCDYHRYMKERVDRTVNSVLEELVDQTWIRR